jgi:hypothetical protein
MPRKKQSGETAVQVVFRVPQSLHDAVQAAAQGLGLDLSNLLRMMLAEHVAEYIERGKRAAAALEQARAEAQPAPAGATQTREGGGRMGATKGGQRRTIVVDAGEK